MKMVGTIRLAAAMVAAALLLLLAWGPAGPEPTEAASLPWGIDLSKDNLILTEPGTVWLRALPNETAMFEEEFGWATSDDPGTGGTWYVNPLVNCRTAVETPWQSLGILGTGPLDFGIRTLDDYRPPGREGHTMAYVTGGTNVKWDRHSDVYAEEAVDAGVKHNEYDFAGEVVTIRWEDTLGEEHGDFNDCVVQLKWTPLCWSIDPDNDNLMLNVAGEVEARAISFETAMAYEQFGPAGGSGPGTWNVTPLVDCRAAETPWQSLGSFPVGELAVGIRTQDPNLPPGRENHVIAYVTGGTNHAWDRHTDVNVPGQVDDTVKHNNYIISGWGDFVRIYWEDMPGEGGDFNDCVVELRCPTWPQLVGGTTEIQVDSSQPPARPADDSAGGSSVPYQATLAGAAAAGVIALTAGAWYARRRWLR